MKLKLSKTVQTTVLAVLIIPILFTVYVVLFTSGIVNHINLSNQQRNQLVGYVTEEECRKETKDICEMVITESEDQFWVRAKE